MTDDVDDKTALNQLGGPNYGTTATVGPKNNNIGLSAEEFDEFLDISMDIAPKNIKLEMDYDSEPLLKVSLIVKFFFVSITDKTAEEGFENADSLLPENFEKCHLIPVPTIQYLNGRTRTNDDKPIIKKQRFTEKQKERIGELFKRAMNHVDEDTSSGEAKSDEAKSDEPKSEFKAEYFKATQLYEFEAPITKWSIAAQQFPVDIHRIRFAFRLQPLNAYSDPKKNIFELIVPGRKSTDRKLLSTKENFYPYIRKVEKFPPNAETMVSESILEFDIMPNSLKIGSTSPRDQVTKKTNFIITFSLTRHVLGPSLNALVPIYVIAFLTPFTCFFDLTGAFDGVAGYLVTLLLTLVAHRITISDAQTAIMRFTMSDEDFVIGFAFVVIQMIIFVVVFEDDRIDPEKMENEILTLFGIEEMLVSLWVVSRVIGIVMAYNRLLNENEVDLMETNDTMSSAEYRALRADRKQLSQELGTEVNLKSLYSINTKILLREALENDATTNLNHGRTRLPTNDIFRCCLVGTNTNTNIVLLNLEKNKKFDLLYSKKIDLPEEHEDRKKAAKAVYKYTPTHGKTLLLEVQFLSHKDSFTASSHRKYKKDNLEKALKILQENPRTALRKGKVVRMYLESLWVEIFSVSRHNFVSKCKSDWELLRLTLQQLGKQKISTGEEQAKVQGPTQAPAPSDKELSTASQQIQNLLDTGELKIPNTA